MWRDTSSDPVKRTLNTSKNILTLIFAIMSSFGLRIDVLIVLVILPISIMPRFVFKLFLKTYIYLKYSVKGEKMPSEWNYLLSEYKTVDPLRKF